MSARHGEGEEVGWLRAQLAAMTAERDQLRQHLDARQELDQMLMASAPAADGTGPIARVQGPRAAAHRTPKEARWLRVVPVWVLAVFAGIRWAWHVHRAATVAAGMLTLTAATGAAVAVAPHGPIARVLGADPAVTAPAPGLYGAVPVPSASLRLIGSFIRPALDAKSAGPPVVSILVPSPASPSSTVQPSPSPSDTSQPSPADTFQALPADSPQPGWPDSADGRHHHWDGQSPQPSGSISAADTTTPDTSTPAAAPADTSTDAAVTPAATSS